MSDIDFEELVKQLQAENERLRMKLFSAATARPALSFEESLTKARRFVAENYLLIMVSFFVLSAVISGLYTVYRDGKAQP